MECIAGKNDPQYDVSYDISNYFCEKIMREEIILNEFMIIRLHIHRLNNDLYSCKYIYNYLLKDYLSETINKKEMKKLEKWKSRMMCDNCCYFRNIYNIMCCNTKNCKYIICIDCLNKYKKSTYQNDICPICRVRNEWISPPKQKKLESILIILNIKIHNWCVNKIDKNSNKNREIILKSKSKSKIKRRIEPNFITKKINKKNLFSRNIYSYDLNNIEFKKNKYKKSEDMKTIDGKKKYILSLKTIRLLGR